MIKCPVCEEKVHVTKDHASCDAGHVFSMKDGVHQILTPEYKQKLDTFLKGFEDSRKEAITNYTVQVIQKLPFVSFDRGLWKLREYDLNLVSKFIKPDGRALEIGSWNAWLTHHISRAGMDITAVDLFIHDRDGLAAKKHFDENWLAIQMDLQRLNLIDEKFDLIVVNRCFQYFQEMHETVRVLQDRLKKGGVLLLTGLTLESDKERIQQEIDTAALNFESKYGTPFHLHEFQGYNTEESLKKLKNQGVKVKIYPELRIRSMIGHISRKHHIYYYGIFHK